VDELVRKVFNNAPLYSMSEAAGAESTADSRNSEFWTARFTHRTIGYNLVVRNPYYEHHSTGIAGSPVQSAL